ncbi:MAG: D-alanyl-D-alanine carboxypeptidase family protein [Pseudomonadota bacterium]
MSTPAQRGVRPVALPLFPILIILAIGVLLGASLRAGAAPYAAMVMDARTGEVLHSRNADARLHPASLTKMMTLYIAFEAVEAGEIGLDDKVTVSRKAASEVPSKLGLRAGQKIELRYLIRAAAVKSANDAATAIGEAISGSEAAFARRMTRTARALGMTRTTFKNAHGLTEQGHLSTARDMTILGRRLFYDYPEYYNLFSRRSTSAKIATVNNTNRRFLGAYKGADGIKTGYTRAAGFNLVASAERGGERIITTVFGGTSTAARNAEVARLMDIGFKRAPRYAKVVRPAPPNYAGLPDARGHVVSARPGGEAVGPAGAATGAERCRARGCADGRNGERDRRSAGSDGWRCGPRGVGARCAGECGGERGAERRRRPRRRRGWRSCGRSRGRGGAARPAGARRCGSDRRRAGSDRRGRRSGAPGDGAARRDARCGGGSPGHCAAERVVPALVADA